MQSLIPKINTCLHGYTVETSMFLYGQSLAKKRAYFVKLELVKL